MATHARLLRRLAVLAVLLFTTLPSTGLALTQVSGFGSNPGNLLMYKYVPAGLPSGAPLVVALHGCTQQASAYDAETGRFGWIDTDSSSVRRQYEDRFAKNRERMQATFRKTGASWVSISTDESYVNALLKFFQQRTK